MIAYSLFLTQKSYAKVNLDFGHVEGKAQMDWSYPRKERVQNVNDDVM